MSKIDESAKNRVLVLGKGTSGNAAAMLAGRKGKSVDFANGYELVVASPGVRVMSELEYGCRELKRRGTKLLAVTGSKGKSSVVKLVADALSLAGHTAVPCGNYGTAVSEVALGQEAPEWAVVEVSSFMMETTNLPPDTFEAAAVINLQEDHLDRHGSLELYHALKRRLLCFAKVAIDGTSLPTGGCKLPKGCYFDNDVLRANGAVAAELMRAAGLCGEDVEHAFLAFKPLHHRFEPVAEIGGVRFVDDSKATSVAALVAGVEMAHGKVRLIAGGLSKGDDPKIAREHLTKRAKKVYLIGQCAEEFRSAWADAVDCEVCGTMERAVEAAMRDAEKGDTVLLSPGTASFDQFTNFEVRGDVFASLVKKRRTKNKMNKLGMVLGLAAVAAIAGCKDPNWNRGNSHANAAKNVATDVEATPINAEETKSSETTTAPVVEEEKHCTCAPGTVHDLPCACGANDCRCIVMKNDKKPAPPPEPEYTVYIVQRGDYIAKISKKFNVTIDSIKRLNNLKSDKILLGQKLKLPGKLDVGEQTVPAGAVKESPKAKKTYASYTGPTKEYVVKNGDTLGAIAYGNGINIRQLKELNGLDKDSLRVGQKLKIPAEKVQKPQSKAAAAPAPKAEKKAEAPVAAPAPVAEQPASAETDAQATDAATVNPVVEETAPVVEAPAEAITYRVQEGEDLADVSIRWGVSAAAVRELNNLSEDDVLKPGQILRLPADAQQN